MKTINRYRPFLLLLLALMCAGPGFAAGLEAILDRTRIAEGDTLTLFLRAPGGAQGTPDLRPLDRDFEILEQGQSTRMSIVNGRSESTREWRLLLAPKQGGKLSIPALTLGALSSAPLALEVVPASRAAPAGEGAPVILEVEVDQESPYVQAQVVYTVRVLHRVPLRQASLSDPAPADVIVERLGEDKRYTSVRDGQSYEVIERRYALFPQRSGALEIAAPRLSTTVPEQGGRRQPSRDRFGGDLDRFFGGDPFADLDGLFERTRPVRVYGRNLSLDVRPQPAGSPSPWLPAESLQLAETWAPSVQEFRVGEPVTRTIAITATGLTAAQLPNLAAEVPEGVKVYPNQAQPETRAEGDDILAMKVIEQALVPSREGELTLPEVRLSWWDTGANRERVAALPARKVVVLPARPGVATGSPAPAPEATETHAPRQQATGEAPAPAARPEETPTGGIDPLGAISLLGSPWTWISAALAIAWLITLGLWLHERRKAAGRREAAALAPARQAPLPSPTKARARVQQACATGDPKAAREALLAWGAARWPDRPPERLEILADRLGGEARDAMRELDRCLYAPGGAGWDGAWAWKALAPALAEALAHGERSGVQDAALPDLYPRQA